MNNSANNTTSIRKQIIEKIDLLIYDKDFTKKEQNISNF